MNKSLRIVCVCAAMLTILSASALAISNPAGDIAHSGAVSQFNLSEKTDIPGHTLKPGAYAITVVDHLSDRIVLRVDDSTGKEQAMFLAVPATPNLSSAAQPGPIEMKTGKSSRSALRGFKFDDGTVAEFVYPKTEAVSLAKANSTTIPAIDPASEGRVAAPNLSRDDMALVTLWMLTPTTVGPDKQAAVQAERYHPGATNTSVASNSAAPNLPSSTASNLEARTTATAPPVRVAHPVQALPHTASELPLVLIFGLIALVSAASLALRRTAIVRAG